MKRSWDLIRALLIGMSECKLHEIKDHNAGEILYHWYLLNDAGYIDATRWNGNITPKGKQILEALRDDRAYACALEIIEQNGGGATEEVLVGLIEKQKG